MKLYQLESILDARLKRADWRLAWFLFHGALVVYIGAVFYVGGVMA